MKNLYLIIPIFVVSTVLFININATFAEKTEEALSPGLHDRLGEHIATDMPFNTVDGEVVHIKDLLDKPTILSLVYFQCPNICNPIMQHLSKRVNDSAMKLGEDYQIITVSINEMEDPALAKKTKAGLMALLEKPAPDKSWHFLTGSRENIVALANSAGYGFGRDGDKIAHPTSIIYLSADGKIVRYMNGNNFLPAEMTMAINDANSGTARAFMSKLAKLCFSYDAEGRRHLSVVNKIILFVSCTGIGIFAFFLFKKKKTLSVTEG